MGASWELTVSDDIFGNVQIGAISFDFQSITNSMEESKGHSMD